MPESEGSVMFASHALKVLSLMFVVACTSCSSANQSITQTVEVEKVMERSLLHVGIKTPAAPQQALSVISFYVENGTGQDAQLLTWNTPFEQRLSADIFAVTRNGEAMTYLGRMIKRGSPTAESYLPIATGEKLEALIDIADYYDVTSPGEYTVSLKIAQVAGVAQLNQESSVSVDESSVSWAVSE